MADYRFPDNLTEGGHGYMKIEILNPRGDRVKSTASLYIPPGISFQDGATYGNINIGAIGAELINKNADNLLSAMGQYASGIDVGAVASQAVNSVKNTTGAIVASILNKSARNLPMNGSLASGTELYGFATKQVLNPYTNVAFTGSTLRSFTFNFKLIASSNKESITIRNMLNEFRENMYPEENGKFILKYPSKFRITFWTGSSAEGGNRESDYIPKIYECNMVSLGVVYNQQSPMFFKDGTPSEVDVSMTFQETKALTANDIKLMESSKARNSNQRDAYKKAISAMENINKGITGGF